MRMIAIKPLLFVVLLQIVPKVTCEKCQEETKEKLIWPASDSGQRVRVKCPHDDEPGEAIRECSVSATWVADVNYTGCSLQSLEDLYSRARNASNNITQLVDVAKDLAIKTKDGRSIKYSGQLALSVNLLQYLFSTRALTGLTVASGTVDGDAFIQNLTETTDNLLDSEYFVSMWRNIHKYKDPKFFLTFLKQLESFGDIVTSYLDRVEHSHRNLTITTTTNIQSIYEVVLDNNKDVVHEFAGFTTKVTIPQSALPKVPGRNTSVSTLAFSSSIHDLFPPQIENTSIHVEARNLTSFLVSCNIFPKPTTPFPDSVEIRMKNDEILPNSTCSYLKYNDTNSVWKEDIVGCQKPIFNAADKTVTCRCTHLTTFVVIGKYNTRGHLPEGILASIVFYLVLIGTTFGLVLYANRKFDSDRASLVLCFLATLFTGHVTLVAGVYAIDNMNSCRAVALLLHYFQLSYSFWMLAQAVQLVLKVTYKTVETGTVAQFCALGWITPLFVVASTAGLNINQYGRGNHCSIPLGSGISYALIVPVCLLACTNFVCLFYTFYCIYRIKKTDRKCLAQMNVILPNIRACLIVLPLEICEWIFTALSVDFEYVIYDILWAVTVFIMSILILLFYGIGSSEVVEEYEKHFGPCCWQHKKSSAVHDSPRPGWRDEISQISQYREASSIMRDMDSIATVAGNGSVAGCSGVSNGGLEPDDVLARGKELNEPSGLTSSSLTSSFMLKTKLKVFPLRKNQADPSPKQNQGNSR